MSFVSGMRALGYELFRISEGYMYSGLSKQVSGNYFECLRLSGLWSCLARQSGDMRLYGVGM